MTLEFRILYLISAFVPVHIVAAISLFACGRTTVAYAAVALGVFGGLTTVYLIASFVGRHSGDILKISDCVSQDAEVFSFLAVFLPFIVGVDLSNSATFASVLVFYVVCLFVFVRMERLVPNTLLLLSGWRPYAANINREDAKQPVLIISNRQPMIEMGDIEIARIGHSGVYVNVSN